MSEEFQEITAEEYQEQYPEDTPEVQEQAKLMLLPLFIFACLWRRGFGLKRFLL